MIWKVSIQANHLKVHSSHSLFINAHVVGKVISGERRIHWNLKPEKVAISWALAGICSLMLKKNCIRHLFRVSALQAHRRMITRPCRTRGAPSRRSIMVNASPANWSAALPKEPSQRLAPSKSRARRRSTCSSMPQNWSVKFSNLFALIFEYHLVKKKP